MKTYITCQDELSKTVHQLRLENKIGKGKFSVYHVYSETQNTDYAIKIFPKSTFGTKHYQKELICSKLKHPNIIQYIPFHYLSSKSLGLITEYSKYGDFLNLLTKAGPLGSEILVRTYFRQLIEGLEYIHSQGIAHLDLKLENLVFGNDFRLKIIDFDQAQPIAQGNMTSAGTSNSRAPEVIEERCDNLTAADIYSAGVILFALKAGQFPFEEIDQDEGVCLYPYSVFMKDNNQFWKDKDECLEGIGEFSEDLKNLINGMLEYNPDKRMTIQEIKESKWYKGPVLSKENLQVKMTAL